MYPFFRKYLKRCLFVGSIVAMISCSDFNGRSPESQTSRLLPEAPPQWSEIGGTRIFHGIALSDYINGGSEAYYAYGFREVAVRDFENESGARLTVEIYEMDRPENAYGIYSTDSAGERWSMGADASYGDGLLRFWKGPYFVRIMCHPPDPSIEAIIRGIGHMVAEAIERGDPSPKSLRPEFFLSLPPESGVVADSVCYFHRQTSLNNIRFISDENLLHLGDDVDAITWEEQVPNTEGEGRGSAAATLRQIALNYPSESRAEAAARDLGDKYLNIDIAHDAGSRTPLTASLKNGKFAALDRRAAWVVVSIDAPSAETACQAVERTVKKLGRAPEAEGSS